MKKILIGIDPDVTASGFAFLHNGRVQLKTLRFFELFKLLYGITKTPEYADCKIEVYVECGFLNGGNRHFKAAASTEFNGKISERVGENHQVAKKICEMCEFLQLEFTQVKPTRSKSNAEQFKKITGIKTVTNQEERDAFMLVFGR